MHLRLKVQFASPICIFIASQQSLVCQLLQKQKKYLQDSFEPVNKTGHWHENNFSKLVKHKIKKKRTKKGGYLN